jgi:hypothetical protein
LKHKNNQYEAKYIPILLDFFSQGKSLAEFCAHIGKPKKTFYVWVDRYKEFEEAYDLAKIKAEAYWNQATHDNITNPDFNFGAAKWIMGNRFGISGQRKIKIGKYIDTRDLMGSFEKVVAAYDSEGCDLDELQKTLKILLDLASLKEKIELEQRIASLESRIENNEQV